MQKFVQLYIERIITWNLIWYNIPYNSMPIKKEDKKIIKYWSKFGYVKVSCVFRQNLFLHENKGSFLKEQ